MSGQRSPQGDTVKPPPVVMVVEDEFTTRWATSEYLRDAGYRVIEAENAAAAISVFDSGVRPQFVFSDVNMPGGDDGHRLASWLASHHPEIPMILTSNAAAESVKAAEGPLRRFVRKPYDLAQITALIERMLEHG